MRIFVKAKPLSREEKVEQIDETHFVVSVKEPPVRGKANSALVFAIAWHFRVPPGNVRIISGHTSRQKIIEIQPRQ